ncbi:hypothetical protein ASC94_21165 [Massilia sp. Root418]|jgi:hypothetical protein|uniref:hypothetical protein n=1 Tax=Massilia sp. Root418 TaxID=1736532 RepID=UPI0006F82C15|nr:hypothetical protein [Massilia sp. Root418]KQW90236.1 hypothetical protein ASC94_21165 [Massilia sp. Root418]
MNIAKNMEAIFIATVALAGVASFATAAVPATAPAPVTVTVAKAAPMQVVTITAKRLSAAEKAALAN